MINNDKLKSKSIGRVTFLNILGSVILNGINFFTLPIFTRLLGTSDYGVYSIYIAYLNIITVIVGLQVQSSIGTATIHIQKKQLDNYFSNIMIIVLLNFTVICFLVYSFMDSISAKIGLSPLLIYIMLINALGLVGVNFTTGKYTYDKEPYKTILISTSISIVSTILSICLIISNWMTEKYLGRVIGYSLPNVIVGVFFILYFIFKGKFLLNKDHWKFCLGFSLPLIFHNLSQIILSQSDRVMLQHYTDESTVGIYSLVFTFAQVVSIAWSALNNTWVPFYYDDVKSGNIAAIKTKTQNYLFLFTIVTIGFIYLSPEVIKIFASPDFWSGIDLVPILALGMYFIFLYSFPVNFQFYHKKTLNIAIGTVSSAVLNIILNFLLIPKFSMLGAAYATFISYVALFIFHQLVAKYVIKEEYHYSFKTFSSYILILFAFLGIFYVIKDYWILRWIIAALLGILLIVKIIKNRSIF